MDIGTEFSFTKYSCIDVYFGTQPAARYETRGTLINNRMAFNPNWRKGPDRLIRALLPSTRTFQEEER